MKFESKSLVIDLETVNRIWYDAYHLYLDEEFCYKFEFKDGSRLEVTNWSWDEFFGFQEWLFEKLRVVRDRVETRLAIFGYEPKEVLVWDRKADVG